MKEQSAMERTEPSLREIEETTPTQSPAAKPWRKRHPILARVVLYTLGALLAAGLYFALEQRKDQNRADEIEADLKILEAMPITLVSDPSGNIVKEALERRFEGRELRRDVEMQLERWNAIVHRRQQKFADAAQALDRADKLAESAEDRDAILLERANVQLEAQDAAGAIKLLDTPFERRPYDPLVSLRTIVRAGTFRTMKMGDRALRELRAYTSSLPARLPDEPVRRAGGRDWTPSEAACVAFETLIESVPAKEAEQLWARLHEIAPSNLNAQVACARGLLKVGNKELAARAWQVAKRISPDEASKYAASEAVLRELNGR